MDELQSYPEHEEPVRTKKLQLGPVRVTVPLYGLALSLPEETRLRLGKDAVLAHLNETERHRIAWHLGREFGPEWRLELHNQHFEVQEEVHEHQADDGDRWSWTVRTYPNQDPRTLVRARIAILSLVDPYAPAWENFSIDAFDQGRGCWVRQDLIFDEGGARRGEHGYPREIELRRIGWWQDLFANWPSAYNPQLETALEYFLESVVELDDNRLRNSAIAGFIALEVLLGGGNRSELRHRIAQRGAHLVAAGPDGWDVYRYIKSQYDARSALFHGGVLQHGRDDLVRLHQLLRRAIPSMAYLISLAGNNEEAVAWLDRATFDPGLLPDDLHAPGRWWNFLDFAMTLRRSVPDKPMSGEHGGYWKEPDFSQ